MSLNMIPKLPVDLGIILEDRFTGYGKQAAADHVTGCGEPATEDNATGYGVLLAQAAGAPVNTGGNKQRDAEKLVEELKKLFIQKFKRMERIIKKTKVKIKVAAPDEFKDLLHESKKRFYLENVIECMIELQRALVRDILLSKELDRLGINKTYREAKAPPVKGDVNEASEETPVSFDYEVMKAQIIKTVKEGGDILNIPELYKGEVEKIVRRVREICDVKNQLKPEEITMLKSKYELGLILPENTEDVRGHYSESYNIIYLRDDSVEKWVIAHEMMHLYTSKKLRQQMILLLLWGKEDRLLSEMPADLFMYQMGLVPGDYSLVNGIRKSVTGAASFVNEIMTAFFEDIGGGDKAIGENKFWEAYFANYSEIKNLDSMEPKEIVFQYGKEIKEWKYKPYLVTEGKLQEICNKYNINMDWIKNK